MAFATQHLYSYLCYSPNHPGCDFMPKSGARLGRDCDKLPAGDAAKVTFVQRRDRWFDSFEAANSVEPLPLQPLMRDVPSHLSETGRFVLVASKTLFASRLWAAMEAHLPSGHFYFPAGYTARDATAEAVTLCTRVAARSGRPCSIPLVVQISTDPQFDVLVGERVVKASAEAGFEVCVEVMNLRPGTDYFYRFRAEGDAPPIIGRTRTEAFLLRDEAAEMLADSPRSSYAGLVRLGDLHRATGEPVEIGPVLTPSCQP